MRRVGNWLLWWAVLFGFSLLVLGVLDRVELVFGAGAAALGATAAEATRSQGLLCFRLELRHVLRIWRPLLQVVPDFVVLTIRLGRSLVRRPPAGGRFRAFRVPTGGTDARGAARRAWLTAAGSLAPNTLVVDVDPKQGVVLVHQLDPTRSPELPQ